MKKLSQVIAWITLVGATLTAQANTVYVNHEGLGGVLLYPVYTVNNENATLVSVTNTTGQYKAVKVRFLEGKNSVEVLDFHLYLSPYDVWSGSVIATQNGARLMSRDTSCIPGFDSGFPVEGLEFRNSEIFEDSKVQDGTTSVGADLSESRVRIGHFEVIEMGVLDPEFELVLGNPATKVNTAIQHVNSVPGDCSAVTKAWSIGGVWEGDGTKSDQYSQTAGLSAPTGGLYGTAVIVNVPGGWAASYDAVALGAAGKVVNMAGNMEINSSGEITAHIPTLGELARGPGVVSGNGTWNAAQAGGGLWSIPQHPRPGSVYPNLDTIDIHTTSAFPFYDVNGDVAYKDDVTLDMFTQLSDGAGRVNDALSLSEIYNDYYIQQELGAETDMVISFPSKRFHVNIRPEVLVAGEYIRNRSVPFTNGWNLNKNKSCEEITVTYHDKEEGIGIVDIDMVSPRPQEPKLSLCYETNILSIGKHSDIFGGQDLRQQFDVAFTGGWLSVVLKGAGDPDAKPAADPSWGPNAGLPVIGFSIILTKNGNAGGSGVLANYAQSFKNKTSY